MTTQSDEAVLAGAMSSAASEATAAPQKPRLAVHFALVLVSVSCVAAAFGGWPAARSAGLGVLLAGVNLFVMRRMMGALAGAGGGSAAWAMALPFKLVALVGAAFALVDFGFAQPVPLAIGFALLPLTGVFLPRASSVPRVIVPPRPVIPGQPLK